MSSHPSSVHPAGREQGSGKGSIVLWEPAVRAGYRPSLPPSAFLPAVLVSPPRPLPSSPLSSPLPSLSPFPSPPLPPSLLPPSLPSTPLPQGWLSLEDCLNSALAVSCFALFFCSGYQISQTAALGCRQPQHPQSEQRGRRGAPEASRAANPRRNLCHVVSENRNQTQFSEALFGASLSTFHPVSFLGWPSAEGPGNRKFGKLCLLLSGGCPSPYTVSSSGGQVSLFAPSWASAASPGPRDHHGCSQIHKVFVYCWAGCSLYKDTSQSSKQTWNSAQPPLCGLHISPGPVPAQRKSTFF